MGELLQTCGTTYYSPPPDDNTHRFDDELLDDLDSPVNNDYCNVSPSLLKPVTMEPTFSVVEMHQPCHAPSDPEEASALNMPTDSGIKVDKKEGTISNKVKV